MTAPVLKWKLPGDELEFVGPYGLVTVRQMPLITLGSSWYEDTLVDTSATAVLLGKNGRPAEPDHAEGLQRWRQAASGGYVLPVFGMNRVPTEKQYQALCSLGSGSAGLSRTKRDTEPLLRRGWVTAEWSPPYYQWVRITPDGLRALAAAVEKFGLLDLSPKTTPRRVCADCGSRSYRFESVTAEEAMA